MKCTKNISHMHPDSYISILKTFKAYKIPIQILIKRVAKISYCLCNDGIGRVISNTTWVICPFKASCFNSYVSRFSPRSSPAVLDDPMSLRIMIASGRVISIANGKYSVVQSVGGSAVQDTARVELP